MEVREFDSWDDMIDHLLNEIFAPSDEHHPLEGDGCGFPHAEHKVFRPEYRELAEEQKDSIATIKGLAATMLAEINEASQDSRCSCLARTRLEEAVMWAVKGIS